MEDLGMVLAIPSTVVTVLASVVVAAEVAIDQESSFTGFFRGFIKNFFRFIFIIAISLSLFELGAALVFYFWHLFYKFLDL